jgi:hypothetical protein
LFETWLLNHAQYGVGKGAPVERRWPLIAIVMVALLAIAALLLIVNLSTVPQQTGGSTAQPTVTLAEGE